MVIYTLQTSALKTEFSPDLWCHVVFWIVNEPLKVPGQWVLHSCSSDLCTDFEVFWAGSRHLKLWTLVFWNVMLCTFKFGEIIGPLSPRRWRHQFASEHDSLLTLLHSITSQKASSLNITNVQNRNTEYPTLFNSEPPYFILNTGIMVFGHLGMKLTYVLWINKL